jgi:hypothetical protein
MKRKTCQRLKDSFSRWKADLFRPPGKPGRNQSSIPTRRRYLLTLLFAGLGVTSGFYLDLPEPLVVATGLLMWVMAEHLPEEHTTLAGFFRLGGGSAHVLAGVVIVVEMLSRHGLI